MKGLAVISLLIFSLSTQANDKEEMAMIDKAKAQVIDMLKDPDSAKFYDVHVSINTKGDKSVCGFVNSKNSYGGYVGKQPFFMSEAIVEIVSPNDDTEGLSLSGCLGKDEEINQRIKNESEFSCETIWKLIEDISIRGYSKESAISIALTSTQNRARENGSTMTKAQESAIRTQYEISSDQALTDESKKAIKENPHIREQFMSSCIDNSILATKQALQISEN